MQKILFNDEYGLTETVLNGKKTMTRRIEPFCGFLPDAIDIGFSRFKALNKGVLRCYNDKSNTCIQYRTRYKLGEVVAIAQRYGNLNKIPPNLVCPMMNSKGWNNKMFVRADLMPHQIKITGIKIERLQDISEEDCLKEGIIEHISHNRIYWTYRGIGNYFFDTPKEAYASLIDKISGKWTWEENPFVVAYSFKLVK